jgi:hypothetical protein
MNCDSSASRKGALCVARQFRKTSERAHHFAPGVHPGGEGVHVGHAPFRQSVRRTWRRWRRHFPPTAFAFKLLIVVDY